MATRKTKPNPDAHTEAYMTMFMPAGTLTQQMQAGLGTLLRMNAGMMRFVGERMRAQADLWEGMSRCKDMKEAWSLGTHFTQSAMDSYRTEALTVMDELRVPEARNGAQEAGSSRGGARANGH